MNRSPIYLVAVLVGIIFSIGHSADAAPRDHAKLIEDIVSSVEKGQVIDSSLSIGCSKEDVITELGNPNKENLEKIGGNMIYKEQGLTFTYLGDSRDSFVVAIKKTTKEIREITLEEIRNAEIKNLILFSEDTASVSIGGNLLSFHFEASPEDPRNPRVQDVQVTYLLGITIPEIDLV